MATRWLWEMGNLLIHGLWTVDCDLWEVKMEERLKCKKCGMLVITVPHSEMGEVMLCECQNNFQASFEEDLWEMEEEEKEEGNG